MRWRLVVIVLVGCNGAFDLDETQLDTRPDRDGDRIPDEEDDCIAAADDLAFDSDGDGVPNKDDACALLFDLGIDSDGDGVDNGCELFPAIAGDRRRCSNAFRDPLLTVSFLQSRRAQEFAVGRGFIIGPPDAEAVAAEPLIAATGTSVFDAITSSVADDAPYAIELLVSAGDTPSNNDLACIVIAGLNETQIGMQGATPRTASSPGPARGTDAIYLRAVFQPGKAGDNILCGASYGNETLVAYGHYDGPVQRQGFWVPGGGAVIIGYTIVERDDQPALP